MPGKLRADQIEGSQDWKTIQIPTGTGNSDEYIQDLFTGRKSIKIYPAELTITGQWVDASGYGTTGTQSAIEAALTAIGSDTRMLLLNPGTWTITSNLAIPSNVILWPLPGAVLDVASGVTVTVYKIFAERFKIFTLNGTAIVTGLSESEAEWFGVSTTETAANNAIYMQKAAYSVATSGGIVHLTIPGTYSASAVVDLYSKTIIHLGMGVTWDISSFVLSDRIAFRALGAAGATTSLTGDHSAGVTSLSVGTISGFAADAELFISGATWGGATDYGVIKSVTGTTITLKYPIHYYWSSSDYVKSFTPKQDVAVIGPGWIVDDAATVNTCLVNFRKGLRCFAKDLRMRVYSSTGNLGRGVEVGGTPADFDIVAYGYTKNCYLEGNPQYGLHTRPHVFGYDTLENKVLIESGTNAIEIGGVKGNVLANQVNGGTYGIWVNEVRDIKVLQNDISNCTTAIGLDVTQNLGNVLVGGNMGRSCGTGLYVNGDATRSSAYGIVIEPNNFRLCTKAYDYGSGIGSDNNFPGITVIPGGYPSLRLCSGIGTQSFSGAQDAYTFDIPGGTMSVGGGFRVRMRVYPTGGSTVTVSVKLVQDSLTVYTLSNNRGTGGEYWNVEWIIVQDADGVTNLQHATNIFNYGSSISTGQYDITGLDTAEDWQLVIAVGANSYEFHEVSVEPLGTTS